MRLTSSDRNSLVRLAASLPKGDPQRRAILSGLQKRSGFDPQEYVNPNDHYQHTAEETDGAMADVERALESKGWRTSRKEPEYGDDNEFEGEVRAQKGRDKATVYVRGYLLEDRNGDLVDDVDYFYALWDAKWWDYQTGDEQEFEEPGRGDPKKMAKEIAEEMTRIHDRDGTG